MSNSRDVYCWDVGFLTSQLVPGGLKFESISAGAGHTCGVTPDGSLYCWGRNDKGQLGDGTTVNRLTPVRVSEAP